MSYLLVGIGGMLGSMARHAVGSAALHLWPSIKFPFGTLAVNLIGCLLIGILAGAIERLAVGNAEWRLFAVVGILGGFTTFSAFGIETLTLLRSGHLGLALGYVLASVLLGVAFCALGLKLAN